MGRIGRGTIFGTVPHEHHRLRRSALNPFFSKRSILGIEPQIQEKVDKLCRRLGAYAGQSEPLNLEAAYMSLTMDVITHYAYGEPLGLLDLPDFGATWRKMIKMTLECMPFVRHFPWLMDVLDKIPYSIALKFSESIALMLHFQFVKAPIPLRLFKMRLKTS